MRFFRWPLAMFLGLCVCFFGFGTDVRAEVRYQWLGTTGFVIEDGATKLLFDPTFTRPSLWDLVLNRKIQSDEELVRSRLRDWRIDRADGIFISHAHFDHALDLVNVMKSIPSTLYGSKSTRNIAIGGGIAADRIRSVEFGGSYTIGDFKITVFDTPHPKILGILDFAPGTIDQPLVPPARIWDYKTGESAAFLIEHPDGRIFFQQTSQLPKEESAQNGKADVLLVTIANRESSAAIVEKRVHPLEVKHVIPMHFDHFLSPLDPTQVKMLPFVRYSEFEQTVHKRAPDVTLEKPAYGVSKKLLPR